MKFVPLIQTGTPISRTIRANPLFIIGVSIFILSLGAFFGETVFVLIASVTGTSVLAGAVLWMVVGLIITLAGVLSGDTEVRK
jgi:uncharacterized membrane protein